MPWDPIGSNNTVLKQHIYMKQDQETALEWPHAHPDLSTVICIPGHRTHTLCMIRKIVTVKQMVICGRYLFSSPWPKSLCTVLCFSGRGGRDILAILGMTSWPPSSLPLLLYCNQKPCKASITMQSSECWIQFSGPKKNKNIFVDLVQGRFSNTIL